MGRNQLTKDRRKSSMVLAAAVASSAVLFLAGGDAHSLAAGGAGTSIVDGDGPWHFELVTAPPRTFLTNFSGGAGGAPVQLAAASRLRVDPSSRFLPVGVAIERGLQVRTILA